MFQRLKQRWKSGTNSEASSEEGRDSVDEEAAISTRLLEERTQNASVGLINNDELHYIVDYVGSSQISEAQSVPLLLETLKRVKKQQLRTVRVDFTIRDGVLKISSVSENALILTAPLYSVAECAQEPLRGFDDSFGINITSRRAHICHVFQAGSRMEAESIVRAIALSFKGIGEMLRQKKDLKRTKRTLSVPVRIHTDSESSTLSSLGDSFRETRQPSYSSTRKKELEVGSSGRGRLKPTLRNAASPSILRRNLVSTHLPKHVEFSPLSPVPSDCSSDEEKENLQKIRRQESVEDPVEVAMVVQQVEVQVHRAAVQDLDPIDHHSSQHAEKDLKTSDHHGHTHQDGAVKADPDRKVKGVSEEDKKHAADDMKTVVQEVMEQSEVLKNACSFNAPVIDKEYDEEGLQSILAAIQRADIPFIEKCLDEGMCVNSCDHERRSLLHFAVACGRADVARILLERGAEVDWEGPEDRTPLHLAAASGYRSLTQILLAYSANVRAKDSAFHTPLHLSAGHLYNLEVSYMLMEHGARIYENDLQGIRPVDLQKEIKEMQNRLVQSACEAFAATDVAKSRSDSGASSQCPWSKGSNRGRGLPSLAVDRITLLRRNAPTRHDRTASFDSYGDESVDLNRDGRYVVDSFDGIEHKPELKRRRTFSRSESFEKKESGPDVSADSMVLKNVTEEMESELEKSNTSSEDKTTTTTTPSATSERTTTTASASSELSSPSLTGTLVQDKPVCSSGTDTPEGRNMGMRKQKVASEMTESDECNAMIVVHVEEVKSIDLNIAPDIEGDATESSTLLSAHVEEVDGGGREAKSDQRILDQNVAPDEAEDFESTALLVKHAEEVTLGGRESKLVQRTLDQNVAPHEAEVFESTALLVKHVDEDEINVGNAKFGKRTSDQNVNKNESDVLESMALLVGHTEEQAPTGISEYFPLVAQTKETKTGDICKDSTHGTLDHVLEESKAVDSDNMLVEHSQQTPHAESDILQKTHNPVNNDSEMNLSLSMNDLFWFQSPNLSAKHGDDKHQQIATDLINFAEENNSGGTKTCIVVDTVPAVKVPVHDDDDDGDVDDDDDDDDDENHPVVSSLPDHALLTRPRPGHFRQLSFESEHSEGQHSLRPSEPEDTCSTTGSHFTREEDQAIDALNQLLTLSGNPECNDALLSYICIPKYSSQIIWLAHSPAITPSVANTIAQFISNLFKVEGPESRRRAVNAGLVKTVLDLIDSIEPIQSTCLSILDCLLYSGNDREYTSAINSIPTETLLNTLHTNDNDSGACDLRHDDMLPSHSHVGHDAASHDEVGSAVTRTESKSSHTTSTPDRNSRRRSITDDKHKEIPSVSVGRARSFSAGGGSGTDAKRHDGTALERGRPHRTSNSSDRVAGRHGTRRNSTGCGDLAWPVHGAFGRVKRPSGSSSFSFPEAEGSFASLYSGHSGMMSVVDHRSPRLVITKMMAATSTHTKMQKDLGKARFIEILFETLNDLNKEIVLYTTITLANIAMNPANHKQFYSLGGLTKMKEYLRHEEPRICFHASRCLVYTGDVADNNIMSLFETVQGDDRLEVLFADTTDDEHLYVRGATVEKIVELLTTNSELLWGGLFNLPPPSPKAKTLAEKHGFAKDPVTRQPSEKQVIDFILTTHQSYISTVVLMRLCIHRFIFEPSFHKLFMESEQSEVKLDETSPLPTVHVHLMRVWESWLSKYSEDFSDNAQTLKEISEFSEKIKKLGGPYVPCAERIQELIQTMDYPSKRKLSIEQDANHVHHDILFRQCQKAILSGNLPCTVEDAIYLTALQLFIEDITCTSSTPEQTKKSSRSSLGNKLTPSRMKLNLNPTFFKVKNISKRIKTHYEHFMNHPGSSRNLIHDYVDLCQGMVGFGCKFFKLKELVRTSDKRISSVKRLLGISPQRIVLLDERTKEVYEKWQFNDLKRWEPSEADNKIKFLFMDKEIDFLMDNKGIFREISVVIWNCTKARKWMGWSEADFKPWSKLAEETEQWGKVAMIANFPKHDPQAEMTQKCRDRAVTFAVNTSEKKEKSFFKMPYSFKLSTSAPAQNEVSLTTETSSLITPHEMLVSTTPTDEQTFEESPFSPVLTPDSFSVPGPSGLQAALSLPTGKDFETFLPADSSVSSINSVKSLEINCPVKLPSSHSQNRLSSGSHDSVENMEHNPQLISATSSLRSTPASSRHSIMKPHAEEEACKDKISIIGDDECSDSSYSPNMKVCLCPPDAELPGFRRNQFSIYQLLQHPKELARQITLIDHELFQAVTATDLLKKISDGSGSKRKMPASIEKVVARFNQLTVWVAESLLNEPQVHIRAKMFGNFVETAKQCFELRNYNAIMAIVVSGLCCAPVRRLTSTKELVDKSIIEQFAKLEMLMDPVNNHKKYRETLRSSPTPAVPYFGIYSKDLTFIADGNPDYLKGGLINLTKRRQIYAVIGEMRHFQKKPYNFQEVLEIREYLLNCDQHSDEQLQETNKRFDKLSRQLEMGRPKSHSQSSGSAPAHASLTRRSTLPSFRSQSIGRSASKKRQRSSKHRPADGS